ncbi:MAG: methionine--tRNA ligase, partial [Candidatus Omnitrophica bacterium]|nr:methionine--tRNA ligase [Candidatus Omnitrophota bacterium]
LTTPLYYVNARPHIGHAYTTVLADCFARWHRMTGEEVFLLTGTDEHGEKIAQAAQAKGISPQAFVDENSKTFRSLWEILGISYDHFIRTTDAEHQSAVRKVLETLKANGMLTQGTYTFWYCVPCETGWSQSDFPDPKQRACPTCQRPVEKVTEEDFFLDLEAHRGWLKKEIQDHPGFIRPESRRNEVLGMLEKELPPLCITRPRERVSWGIEVPFSPSHVTYVWFDALLNYITALGWPDGEKFKAFWEGTGAVHLIGKDILRHHAVYWPILLHALGIRPPKMIFAHGWWLVKGEKMSKSKGNIVDPQAVVEGYGLDAFRYFLLRDVPLGEDGVFSEEALAKRFNSDLANDLGNLLYRTLTMFEKHAEGKIPPSPPATEAAEWISSAWQGVEAGILNWTPDAALRSIWDLIGKANHWVESQAPWTLAKEGKKGELHRFLYGLAEILRAAALLLWPFMPRTAGLIWQQLGFDAPIGKERLPESLQGRKIPGGQVIRKGRPLFPKLV